jgi:hypothetical protein
MVEMDINRGNLKDKTSKTYSVNYWKFVLCFLNA